MLEKLTVFLKLLKYQSNNILFKIFFSIGYFGYVLRLKELESFEISPGNILTVVGVSGIILTFIWAKKK